MGKRGPHPSGQALANSERQRRYRERQAERQAGTLSLRLEGFELSVLRSLAEAQGKPAEEVAASILKDALWQHARTVMRNSVT